MAEVDILRVHAVTPLPGDEQALARWTVRHLRACEDWLVRRRPLRIPQAVMLTLRMAHAGAARKDPVDLSALGQRARVRRDRQLRDAELCLIIDRIRADLELYRASLTEGGVDELWLVPVTRTLTPLYLPESQELFLPSWQLDALPSSLFSPTPLFPTPPPTAVAWLFFHSLVLLADGDSRVPTVAQFLGIRESD